MRGVRDTPKCERNDLDMARLSRIGIIIKEKKNPHLSRAQYNKKHVSMEIDPFILSSFDTMEM